MFPETPTYQTLFTLCTVLQKSYFTLFIFTLFKKPEIAEIFLLSQY